MRQPDNARDKRLFDAVFSDPRRAKNAVTHSLTIAGRPVRTSSLRAFTQKDAPAVALEGATPERITRLDERRRVRVDLLVEGRPWREYEGRLIKFSDSDESGAGTAGGSGAFGASTSGYWQGGEDAVRFNERKAYTGRPDAALMDMLARLPYRGIKVPEIPGPDFVKTGENRYPPTSAVGEGIDHVEAEARVVQRDTFLDRAGVYPRPSLGVALGAGASLARKWRVGREVSAFAAVPRNSARFRDVGVVRLLASGAYESLLGYDEKGRPRTIEVRYPPGVEPPPRGTTYYETISAESGERTQNGRTLGLSIAGALYPGEFDVTIETPYVDPRIEDFDRLEVERTDPRTGETRVYRCLIEAQERLYDVPKAVYACTGAIVGRR